MVALVGRTVLFKFAVFSKLVLARPLFFSILPAGRASTLTFSSLAVHGRLSWLYCCSLVASSNSVLF